MDAGASDRQQAAQIADDQIPVHVVALAAVFALDDDAEHVARLEQGAETLEISEVGDQFLALRSA